MNFRIVVSLLLICFFSFGCSSRQESPDDNIVIESSVDPNLIAVVTLKLEGDTLPGTPRVVSAKDTTSAFFDRIGSPEDVRKVGKDMWVTVLTSGESYVIGWIVKDNKMFGYCSDPFEAKNGLEVTFSPGMPASLEYDLSKTEEGVNIFPAILLLSKKAVKNGEVALMSWGENMDIKEPKIIKIDGFAQGTFQLYAQALNAEDYLSSRTRFLYDKRFIEIEPGKVNRFEVQYPVLDTAVEDGDLTIKGLVHKPEGDIVKDAKIKLIPFNDDGPMFDLYYPEAVTDANGCFEFKGVRPDIPVLIKAVDSSMNLPKSTLAKGTTLWVDLMAGRLNFQIYAGYSIADEIFIDWKDGREGTLQDLFNKIVVVDVWSSWCAPGQKALAELNSLAQEFKDNKDIVFVSLGLDASRTVWEETLKKSGLDSLSHGWFARKNTIAFNRPIPYSMVIDKQGIVCAEGNSIDIRTELKKVIEASK